MKTKLLLSAMMLSMSLSLFAQSGTCGTNLTWTLSSGTLTISGTGTMKNYTSSSNAPWYSSYRTSIKTVIIEDGATSIGSYAFYHCSNLTSITIPNSVTSIGEDAFYGCSSLTSITIPNSVTTIGDWAFSECSKLTSVTINSNSVMSKTYSISSNLKNVFGKQVKQYIIGDDIKSIGEYAFYWCSSLTSITIPNSVTSIGNSAFSNCESLTSITIPNSVTSIGGSAFCWCESLTSITIPNSVTSIGGYAFGGCCGLTSIVVENGNAKYDSRNNCNAIIETTTNTLIAGCQNTIIPNSVTSIGHDAFYDCSKLTSVTIPNSVTSIGDYAFRGCSSLTPVTIPNSVTSIGDLAFSYCSSLTSITIPNSVTSIGQRAFEYCSKLTSVHISDLAAWCKIAFYNSTSNPLYSAHNLYLNGTLVTDLVIPDGVTSIENFAFAGCGLTSVTIGESVSSIRDYAFKGCSKLATVIWNAKKFNDFSSYNTPFYCRYDAADLKFDLRQQITSFTFGDNVEYIPAYLCWGMYNLTSITIPNSVTSIGDLAFSYCRSLTSVTIPNSVTSIGSAAFRDCTGLTSVTIGESVTTIENSAFHACSSLTSITIPNSVTSIGQSAFYECSRLTSITCEAVNPPTLGDEVFDYLKKSIPLYVPADAVKRYKSAEGWRDFTNILPISSQTGDVTTPTITVTTTSADIAWPQISGAASYELVIKDKKGNVVCTLVFDAEGHLTSLNFGAPDRDNIHKQPQAGTFSFTVTGLKENTEYTYTLTAKDSKGKAIDTKTGTFKTIGGTPVDETERDAAPAPRKVLKNGIIRILTPDGTAYDLQGHRLD